MDTVQIIEFQEKYAAAFAELNIEWLEKYFYVEAYDKKVLYQAEEYILKKGGHILFAIHQDKAVGTLALIDRDDSGYELSKMAVTEKSQGLGIGHLLIHAAIEKARSLGTPRLFLDSNSKLKPAIHLYQKVGFQEIPFDENTPYERSDIRMEMFF